MNNSNMGDVDIESDESVDAEEDEDLENELLLFNENQAALIRNMSLVNFKNSSMQICISPQSAQQNRKSHTLTEPKDLMVRDDILREYSKSLHRNVQGASLKPPRV